MGPYEAAQVTGCLPLNNQPVRPPKPAQSYRVLALNDARRAGRYVPLRVRCNPQRGPEAVSGTVHGDVNRSRFTPMSPSEQVYNSPAIPCYSKAHGVLLTTDLPTMHCVNR